MPRYLPTYLPHPALAFPCLLWKVRCHWVPSLPARVRRGRQARWDLARKEPQNLTCLLHRACACLVNRNLGKPHNMLNHTTNSALLRLLMSQSLSLYGCIAMDHLPLAYGADRNSTLDSTTSHYPTGPTPTTQHPREPPSTAAPCSLLTGRLTLVTAKRSPAIASVFPHHGRITILFHLGNPVITIRSLLHLCCLQLPCHSHPASPCLPLASLGTNNSPGVPSPSGRSLARADPAPLC